mmetsp:Transcript_14326/g.28188  ORF Transcript_14326/g.28188 Transcript_14326/m.28188 type:complete len:225 (-) Transcript_14326:354-1028(-)
MRAFACFQSRSLFRAGGHNSKLDDDTVDKNAKSERGRERRVVRIRSRVKERSLSPGREEKQERKSRRNGKTREVRKDNGGNHDTSSSSQDRNRVKPTHETQDAAEIINDGEIPKDVVVVPGVKTVRKKTQPESNSLKLTVDDLPTREATKKAALPRKVLKAKSGKSERDIRQEWERGDWVEAKFSRLQGWVPATITRRVFNRSTNMETLEVTEPTTKVVQFSQG